MGVASNRLNSTSVQMTGRNQFNAVLTGSPRAGYLSSFAIGNITDVQCLIRTAQPLGIEFARHFTLYIFGIMLNVIVYLSLNNLHPYPLYLSQVTLQFNSFVIN